MSGLPSGSTRILHLAAVAVAVALLYGVGLSSSPIHLHYDEVYFAEQARSIAQTGRDVNGRLLPVYFQMDNVIWFHPLGVYLPSLAFQFLPVSIAALRLPSAVIGVGDVVLIYFLARRVLGYHWLSLLAAALLGIAPAHFIHSRLALDYLFPTPFVLGWAILLLRYFDARSLLTLFAAASILGIGIYSYIAAVALVPMFLLVTFAMLWREQAPGRAHAAAIAGFCWPLIPALLFLSAHPAVFGSTVGRYGFAGDGLDAFQQLKETFTPWTISDRLNLYMSFFAPGYLFFTGSSGLTESTRTAGIFLAPTLPLVLLGIRAVVLRYSPAAVIVLAGFLLPPIAASIVDESFAGGRAMTMVPFGILLACWGVGVLIVAKPLRGLPSIIGVAGAALLAIGLAYLLYRLRTSELSRGAVVLMMSGTFVVAVAFVVQRQQRLTAIAAALVVACLVHFAAFAQDYFGEYRARSAPSFNGNIRDAVRRAVADLDGRSDHPPVYLSSAIPRIDWYWRFHVAELERMDLATRARPVSDAELQILELAPGTLFLCVAVDDHARSVAEARGMTVVAAITDPNVESETGPGEHPVYLLFRRP